MIITNLKLPYIKKLEQFFNLIYEAIVKVKVAKMQLVIFQMCYRIKGFVNRFVNANKIGRGKLN